MRIKQRVQIEAIIINNQTNNEVSRHYKVQTKIIPNFVKKFEKPQVLNDIKDPCNLAWRKRNYIEQHSPINFFDCKILSSTIQQHS